MSVQQPDLLAANDDLIALLAPVAELTVFDGGVTSATGDELDPTIGPDGRVRHYVVVYDTPGMGFAPALDGQHTAAVQSWQLTCVGGSVRECRWTIRAVRAAVVGQQCGTTGGLYHEPPGARPPIKLDRDARPTRYFGVLLIDATVV